MTNAQQPDLRPFIAYSDVPAGHFLHHVTDASNAPVLMPEDVVIVVPDNSDPIPGELYVIQWQSGNRRKAIVEIWEFQQSDRIYLKNKDGTRCTEPHYMIGGSARQVFRTMDGRPILDPKTGEPMKPTRWADGPYNIDSVRERLLGRVVGMFDPLAGVDARKVEARV